MTPQGVEQPFEHRRACLVASVNPTVTPQGVEQAKAKSKAGGKLGVNPTVTPQGVEQLIHERRTAAIPR